MNKSRERGKEVRGGAFCCCISLQQGVRLRSTWTKEMLGKLESFINLCPPVICFCLLWHFCLLEKASSGSSLEFDRWVGGHMVKWRNRRKQVAQTQRWWRDLDLLMQTEVLSGLAYCSFYNQDYISVRSGANLFPSGLKHDRSNCFWPVSFFQVVFLIQNKFFLAILQQKFLGA